MANAGIQNDAFEGIHTRTKLEANVRHKRRPANAELEATPVDQRRPANS